MTWDVTVTDTLAESHLYKPHRHPLKAPRRVQRTGKKWKYQWLARTHTFIPLAFETFGPINSKGVLFLNQLGRRLTANTGDLRETAFLFQRFSVTIYSAL